MKRASSLWWAPTHFHLFSLAALVACLVVVGWSPTVAQAQFGFGAEDSRATATASVLPGVEDQPPQLKLQVKIADGFYTYALSQPTGGPARPISLKPKLPEGVTFAKPFQADKKPKIVDDEIAGKLHKLTGTVTWTASLSVPEGLDLAELEIPGQIIAIVCSSGPQGTCVREKMSFAAKLSAGTAGPEAAQEPPSPDFQSYRPQGAHLELVGWLTHQAAQPGETVELRITAKPDAQGHYHIYPLGSKGSGIGMTETLIVLTDYQPLKPQGTLVGREPTIGGTDPISGGPLKYYDKPVTWRVPLTIPKDAQPGTLKLSGLVGLQTCTDEVCDGPLSVDFTAKLQIAEQSANQPVALSFGQAASYSKAASALSEQGNWNAGTNLTVKPFEELISADAQEGSQAGKTDAAATVSLASVNWLEVGTYLLLAFAGGFVLNFMPCVLPVIGLKIMSFVGQAGEDRGRVLFLNGVYAVGILSVFLVLATLTALFRFGWGEQFSNAYFVLTLAGLVWVMGLSFLGVWELPIPGFAAGTAANSFVEQEGLTGAFSKGVIATLLATPCVGPFWATAVGFAVSQPVVIVYAVFTSAALGMAMPYLVIGAFPSLVRFLPKPGEWMNTFKQAMGFVLLGTVVFLISILNPEWFIPSFALLIGLWLGCWWIGKIPAGASLMQTFRGWAVGVSMAMLVGVAAFSLLDYEAELDWEPFSRQRLAELQAEGKTVLVDFTADWCINCKYNERWALNRSLTKNLVEQNGVVTLLADNTEYPEEIKSTLQQLKRNAVPLTAIYPANSPADPILLDGVYSQGALLDALQKAGPSKKANTQEASQTALNPEDNPTTLR